MKTISTKELSAKLQSGPMALFDVRGDLEYEKSHIPGARTAPLGALVIRVASLMNPDSEVVVYSSGGECTLATQAVERLENLKMSNVHFYKDGLKGWRAAGHSAIESNNAKVHARGPFVECRSPLVDRKRAYNGVFLQRPSEVMSAGG